MCILIRGYSSLLNVRKEYNREAHDDFHPSPPSSLSLQLSVALTVSPSSISSLPPHLPLCLRSSSPALKSCARTAACSATYSGSSALWMRRTGERKSVEGRGKHEEVSKGTKTHERRRTKFTCVHALLRCFSFPLPHVDAPGTTAFMKVMLPYNVPPPPNPHFT